MLTIPPAVNYPSPLAALPTRWPTTPVEGPKVIPCEIDWGVMGGPGHCVAINFQNNATLNVSQIVAIYVDNSQCGADVRFIFPDTSSTLTVPAYESGTFPVFTNGTYFYVLSPLVIPSDVTNFVIHNYMPPPVSNPKSEFQQSVSVAGISLTGVTNTVILPAGTNGTLEGLFSTASVVAATVAYNMQATLVDGSGATLLAASLGGAIGVTGNYSLFNVTSANLRFQNGLRVVTSGTFASGGQAIVNVLYRTP
jgi:hypothetical protein